MAEGQPHSENVAQSAAQSRRTQRDFAAGFAVAAILAIGWAWLGAAPDSATVGKRLAIPVAERTAAPQYQIQAVEFAGGQVFDLAAARDDVVVMFFMAAWCVTCEPEASALARIHDKYKDRGVQVLVLDVDQTETEIELQAFSDRIGPNGYLWAITGASDILRMYGAKGLDGTIMIDREGRVAYVDTYPTPYVVLEQVVEALL